MRSYRDFEIIVGSPTTSGTPLSARGPGGDARGMLVVPNDPDIRELLERVQRFDADPAALERCGMHLFAALFAGQIRDIYYASQGAIRPDERLRLVLNIAPDAVSIAALPWEILADPGSGPLILRGVPLVRYLPQPAPIPDVAAALPLRVLVTAAQTDPPTAVARELAAVQSALARLGDGLELVVEPHLTAALLRDRLRQGFHIWHFVGHGSFEPDESINLVLEDEQGDPAPLNPAQLALLLRDSNVRLVVLDACHSGSAGSHLHSLAPSLIRAQVPAVVAMQFAVPEESAQTFAREFYLALAAGLPVDACVAEGRKAIFTSLAPGRPDWAIPVLYSRAPALAIVQPTASSSGRTVSDISPYRGLAPFQEQDAALFFGREALVETLLARIAATGFFAVAGASGSGKSSVVRAGLIPAMRGGAIAGSEQWRVAIIRPGARPLDALASELAALHSGAVGVDAAQDLAGRLALSRELAADPQGLIRAADLLLAGRPGSRLVLVVDQAEELWTLEPTEPEQRVSWVATQQQPCLDRLLSAAVAPGLPVLVVFALRADFLHRAAERHDLARLVSDHLVLVSPMQPEELRRAVVEPAEQAGCRFEPGLVDELVAQTAGRDGALPLLQYTLHELWRRRQPDGSLTWAALRELGGVEGALAVRADALLADQYDHDRRDELRQVLLRLVQPGEGAADTRRRMRLDDLETRAEERAVLDRLLRPLIDARLLTVGWDTVNSAETVEVSHEALLRSWPTLQRWIADARDDLRQRLQIEGAADEWVQSGTASDFLWSGLRLATVEAWVARSQPRLNERERQFLDTCRAAEQQRHTAEAQAQQERAALLEARAAADRQSARRLRVFLIAVGILFVLASSLALVANQQARRADQRERVARAEALAAQAQLAGEHSPRLSMLLAVEAVTTTLRLDEPVVPAAEQALRDALSSVNDRVLRGHDSDVGTVSWSPDGRWIATGSADGTARVWDMNGADPSASPSVLRGHDEAVNVVAWGPDGRRLATGSVDGAVRVWDMNGADPSASAYVLSDADSAVNMVVWSPDGRWLATGSADGALQIWDMNAADPSASPLALRGHDDAVRAAAWSPDSHRLLTASSDGTARVWDLLAADPSSDARFLNGDESTDEAIVWSTVVTVAWSPDGRRVVAGDNSGVVAVWDMTVADPLTTVHVLHDDQLIGAVVWQVAWSPDSHWLVSGHEDGIVRLWDMSNADPETTERVLRGHDGQIYSLAWSPDSHWVVTGSWDSTARVWDVTAAEPSATVRVLRGYDGGIGAVAWSPNGDWIVTGNTDGTARLWEAPVVQTSIGSTVLRIHDSSVNTVAWSPDDRWLITKSSDGTVRLWDTTTTPPRTTAHAIVDPGICTLGRPGFGRIGL